VAPNPAPQRIRRPLPGGAARGRSAVPEARLKKDEGSLVHAAQTGGEQERGAFIDAFLPSVASVARPYRSSNAVEWNELMQEGVVGLLRALKRFDPELGFPFWAYACWWVRQAMQELVSELSGPVVMSDRALRQLARIKSARREYQQARGREPGMNDLAQRTGLASSQVQRLMFADRPPRGLEEPAAGEDRGATIGDLFADPRSEDAYESVHSRVAAGAVPRMLAWLDRRERAVISGRYGLEGPTRTLAELAGDLGVSPERVRQIEHASLEKMRAVAA
jgi:RNA polymerase primary sigma factor